MGQEHQIKQRPLAELSYAAIDFESAGAAAGETDHPIQIGIVRVDGLYGIEKHYREYIACTQPIHWRASKVHGITTQDLRHATPYLQQWGAIKEMLQNSIIVGHNLSTEKRFLGRFPAHGFGPWLDTLKLARRVLPDLSDHSLGTVCESLGLKEEIQRLSPQRNWHDAHFDAVGSLVMLRHIVRELQIGREKLNTLHFALGE